MTARRVIVPCVTLSLLIAMILIGIVVVDSSRAPTAIDDALVYGSVAMNAVWLSLLAFFLRRSTPQNN